jgi:hypothetical protein
VPAASDGVTAAVKTHIGLVAGHALLLPSIRTSSNASISADQDDAAKAATRAMTFTQPKASSK